MKDIVSWINGWSNDGKLSLLWFVPVTLLLVYAAIKIVKYAEVIIVKTKFGGAFIGGVLIATITSMPELITGIAQGLYGEPGAGSADNIGSNAFSAFLIGLAGVLFIKETFLKRLGKWTIISLWISFALATITSIMMFFQNDITIGTEGKFAIGLFPIFLFVFYIVSLWLQYKFGDEDVEDHNNPFVKATSAKTAILWFVFWSVLLVSFALVDNWVVSSIQHGYGISSLSAGGVFLSMATSLPEVVAFFVLLRKKQNAAAVAALIGSHIFNLSIEFYVDISYADQATYTMSTIHDNWTLALTTSIMMLLLAIFAVTAPKYKVFDNKYVYVITPTLVMVTYIVGWILMLM